jgi:hypothetical protein
LKRLSILASFCQNYGQRLTTIAESRRNASLHEIDRRRAVLGETLRRSVQEIEDGELVIADGELVIEPTAAEGKNAA